MGHFPYFLQMMPAMSYLTSRFPITFSLLCFIPNILMFAALATEHLLKCCICFEFIRGKLPENEPFEMETGWCLNLRKKYIKMLNQF